MERGRNPAPANHSRSIKIAALAGAAVLFGSLTWLAAQQHNERPRATTGHHNITTTVFWVGEEANESNAQIHNRSSTWQEDWVGAFGGVDDPERRCNMLPCDFAPLENPFYVAIPLNDLNESCEAQPWQSELPWYNPGDPPAEGESAIKNQWIKIRFAGKTAYAQIQDAGPFGEKDKDYVLGNAAPQSEAAGLDISPATAEYLGLQGRGQTSWEFVVEDDVPSGPWKQIVTTSQSDCAGN